MKNLLLPLFLVYHLNGLSQELPEVIPPSPHTQELNKYINFDVSLYNGLAEITIPLHVIKLKGVEIPLNLSYHASGIKKGQTNGEVGLGWVFNAGYRVSRTVYGFPDEESAMPNNIIEILEGFEFPGRERDEYLSQFLETTTGQPFLPYSQNLDGEYDQFQFNLPNGTGAFIIKDRTTREIAMIDQSPTKINYSISNDIIEGFKAIDKKGIQYYFGHQLSNNESVFEYLQNGGGIKTAWALTDLVTPLGEQLQFDYSSGSSGGWQAHVKSFTFYEKDERYSDVNSFYHWNDGKSNLYTTFFLNEITGPQERVIINRNGSQQISSIEIRSKDNYLVKKIKFTYGNNGHIYLDKLTITGSNNEKEEEYVFDYYNRNENPSNFSHDQWGYNMKTGFNGYAYAHLYHEEFFDDIIKTNENPYGSPLSTIFLENAKRSEIHIAPVYFSLRKIKHPTGGSTEYFYENNKFKVFGETKQGGGIRIKQILKRDHDNNTELLRNYVYGHNASGTGFQTVPISHELFTNEGIQFHPTTNQGQVRQQRRITYNTQLQGDIDPAGFLSSNVIYSKVTEYVTSNRNANQFAGKTEYTYNLNHTYNAHTLIPEEYFLPDEDIGFQYRLKSPLFVRRYLTWIKPDLNKIEFFSLEGDEHYTIRKSEHYSYQQSFVTYTGLKVRPFAYSSSYSPAIHDYYRFVPSFFNFKKYEVTTGKRLLSKKTESSYDDEGTLMLSRTINYHYNGAKQLVSETSHSSENEKIEVHWDYPVEMVSKGKDPQGVYMGMVTKNILDPVIEKRNLRSDQVISLVKTNYASWGGKYLLESLETSKGPQNTLEGRIEYLSYDQSGNPVEISKVDGVHVVYLWGYDNQYPIAKIENATLTDVANALNVSESQVFGLDENDLKSINLLRGHPDLSGSMVTTFKFIPLIGLKMIIDPNGRTLTYEYDDSNRLKLIKDQDGNIIEENEYQHQSI